jgi:hypothetical protein
VKIFAVDGVHVIKRDGTLEHVAEVLVATITVEGAHVIRLEEFVDATLEVAVFAMPNGTVCIW